MAHQNIICPGDLYVINEMSRNLYRVPDVRSSQGVFAALELNDHFLVLSIVDDPDKRKWPDSGKWWVLTLSRRGIGWIFLQRFEIEQSHYERVIAA